jgi:hypothetical protein
MGYNFYLKWIDEEFKAEMEEDFKNQNWESLKEHTHKVHIAKRYGKQGVTFDSQGNKYYETLEELHAWLKKGQIVGDDGIRFSYDEFWKIVEEYPSTPCIDETTMFGLTFSKSVNFY